MAAVRSESKEDAQYPIPIVRADGLVLVLNTPKGRGLFACKDIPAHTVIDIAPVLVLDPVENEHHVKKTQLYNYTYNWPCHWSPATSETSKNPRMTQAVVFGLGSLFNHSRRAQNVGWTRDVAKGVIVYKTLRNVVAGEELCISYGDRLTFVDVETAENDSDEEMDGGLGSIDFT